MREHVSYNIYKKLTVDGVVQKDQYLKFQVYYDKGGINYFTGETDKRGYWVAVKPVTKSVSENGVSWEKALMFEGFKCFLKETNRFSRKTLDSILAEVKENINKYISYAINNHLCDKSNIDNNKELYDENV